MTTEQITEAINQYGFPIIAALGLGYFLYYVWEWTTKEIKPTLNEAQTTLIALIDRVRMLDNDMIRLNTKLNTVLEMRSTAKNPQPVDKPGKENKHGKKTNEEDQAKGRP